MAFTPWLNHIKNSYQATHGSDWKSELEDLKKLGKDKFQEGVADLFKRMCENADEAFEQYRDLTAWHSLEQLMEKVVAGTKNHQLRRALENVKLMEDGVEKHEQLKRGFSRKETLRFLTERTQEFIKSEKHLSKDERIKRLVKARCKVQSEQSERSAEQAAYSPEGRFVVNLMGLYIMFLEILAEKLDLVVKPEVIDDSEEEEEKKQQIRFLPQAAPPPRSAPAR
jgi:hypothetical protein